MNKHIESKYLSKILSVFVFIVCVFGKDGTIQDEVFPFPETLKIKNKSLELGFDHQLNIVGFQNETLYFSFYPSTVLSRVGLSYSFGFFTFNSDYENSFEGNYFHHFLSTWYDFDYAYFKTTISYQGFIETFPNETVTYQNKISFKQVFQKEEGYLSFQLRNDYEEDSFFGSSRYALIGGYGIFQSYWIFLPIEWAIASDHVESAIEQVYMGISAEIPVWNFLLFPKISISLDGKARGGLGFDYSHSDKYPKIYGNAILDNVLRFRFKLGISYSFPLDKDREKEQTEKNRAQELKEFYKERKEKRENRVSRSKEKDTPEINNTVEEKGSGPVFHVLTVAPLYNGTGLEKYDNYSELIPILLKVSLGQKDEVVLVEDENTKNWLSFYRQKEKESVDRSIQRLLEEKYGVGWLILSRLKKMNDNYHLEIDFHNFKTGRVLTHNIVMKEPSKRELQLEINKLISKIIFE